MTREALLRVVVGRARGRAYGRALYCLLVERGIDIRSTVCTPEDPWGLSSIADVESWVDRHIRFDEEGDMVRVVVGSA